MTTPTGMWCTKAVDMALNKVSRRLAELGVRARVFSVFTSFSQLKHAKLSNHLSSNNYVVIPICENGHYVAFVVFNGWIYYYDSLAAHDTDSGYFGASWVNRWRDYIREALIADSYRAVKFSVMRQPRQSDGVRCAAYMLSFVTIASQSEPNTWPYYTNKHLLDACEVLDACTSLVNDSL